MSNRNEKVVINLDHAGDRHIMCAWDDCERDGYELYKAVVNYGKADTPRLVSHVFCCERHKQYWINSVKSYGRLPAGSRLCLLPFCDMILEGRLRSGIHQAWRPHLGQRAYHGHALATRQLPSHRGG